MPQIKSLKPVKAVNKEVTGFFIFLHLMAIPAFFPFGFSWSAVAVMLFLYWLTASIGICLGYHRYLTHRSFELPKWLGYFVVFCGALACENGPIKWVGQHRMHHAGSDTDEDPHSAREGFWWAHLGWMVHTHPKFDNQEVIQSYTKDINDDKFYQFLDAHFIKIQIAFGLVLLAIGGWPMVFWGIFLRLIVVYHVTWLVNSASHMFGYVNVRLQDDLATNCWWVGLLAWGEGWHNNHHAFPSSARHGLRPWEFDMTWMAICVLKFFGLATKIKVAKLTPLEDEIEDLFSGEVVKQAA
ncbi:MAG: acyl-CoA desaturase [Candidatus Nitrohelix vancouverensis]|uniref:Acyl-CoA desaturase n=1 Tax=Candidatus Nitrohelix vancouverensis TaxID=2705534 RepID=A0A7T0C2X0_9BACT|nr:MAG: acyl-CoA desaturase [Candidatus Nitrohelix vancouverensis]